MASNAAKRSYREQLHHQIMLEKDKVWKSVVRQAVAQGTMATAEEISPREFKKSKSFGHPIDSDEEEKKNKQNGF